MSYKIPDTSGTYRQVPTAEEINKRFVTDVIIENDTGTADSDSGNDETSAVSIENNARVVRLKKSEFGKVDDVRLNNDTLVNNKIADLTGKVVDTSTNQNDILGVKVFHTIGVTNPIVVDTKTTKVNLENSTVYATETQVYNATHLQVTEESWSED